MGKVVDFSRRLSPSPEVFQPVNYRPTERCKTFVFNPTDGNDYAQLHKAEAVQYALGEEEFNDYHIIELPDSDGPVLRYIEQLPDLTVRVYLTDSSTEFTTYPKDDVNVIGFAFQFIKSLKTGTRWELIRGPACEGTREESAERPIYDVSG